MRSRRSISDIVAVVLLIVIAIAAAVIIYMWLSGLIGSVHTSTSATQVKLEITGASVTPMTSSSTTSSSTNSYIVTASVYNPPASPTVSIATAELEFTNGTLICSTPLTTAIITTTTSSTTTTTTITSIPPSSSANVTFTCTTSATLPAGLPVEIVLVTSEGVQVTYTTTVS